MVSSLATTVSTKLTPLGKGVVSWLLQANNSAVLAAIAVTLKEDLHVFISCAEKCFLAEFRKITSCKKSKIFKIELS